jgi:hypothetical protein
VDRANIYSMLILLAGVAAYAAVWLWPPRRFRPPAPVEPAGDPDEVGLPPAVCGYLLRGCRQADPDFTATLLDLIDRRVIEISPQPGATDDQLLTLHPGRFAQVWPHEEALVRLLFEEAGEHQALTLRRFDRFARERRREYEAGLQAFRQAFAEATLGLQSEPLGRVTIPVSFVIPVLVVWASVYTVAWAETFAYLVSASALAALMMSHATIMYRRVTQTRKYQLRCAQVQRRVAQFAESGEGLSGVHPLWGRYLVFATAFGLDDRVKAALRERPLVPSDIMEGEWPWWQTSAGEQDWGAFLLGGNGSGRAASRKWLR